MFKRIIKRLGYYTLAVFMLGGGRILAKLGEVSYGRRMKKLSIKK